MAYGTGGCVKKSTKKVNKGQTEKKAPGKNSIHHEDLALKTAAPVSYTHLDVYKRQA